MSDDLLNSMVKHREVPHFTDENGNTYYLIKKTDRKWVVKKLAPDESLTIYEVDFMQGKWVCDCPAGFRGHKCKHSTWIGIFSEAGL